MSFQNLKPNIFLYYITIFLIFRGPENFSLKTMPMLLLSEEFCVTLVTIDVVSGSSDLNYIHKCVTQAATNMSELVATLKLWLKTLGMNTTVNEILAFPNLKKAMMRRIIKDKVRRMNFKFFVFYVFILKQFFSNLRKIIFELFLL